MGFRSSANESVNIGGSIGHFDWQKTITVDGVVQPVKIHPLWSLAQTSEFSEGSDDYFGGDKFRVLAFTFPCGQNIEWDPQVGMGESPDLLFFSSGASSKTGLVSGFFMMALVTLLLYLL